jgi:hypothetical protein
MNATFDQPTAAATLYNFLFSWQLIPEKCEYQSGTIPRSGIFSLQLAPDEKTVQVNFSWVTYENQSFQTQYNCVADGAWHPFSHPSVADQIRTQTIGSHEVMMETIQSNEFCWKTHLAIQPNGYLKLTQTGRDEKGNPYTNIQYYHKQLSVLPYAASVSGAVIRHTKEGMIKHKALTAMEEQTDMQLDQIRQQIELLAQQAHAIRKRKELSILVYDAKMQFKPVIGHTYHLYQKQDDSFMLSMIAPQEWGGAGPFKEFYASVKLLADHTWVEVNS